MDWSGIATAIADRERARLGLPTRQQEQDLRAKRAEEAAAAASALETAGVGRELTRAKIAEMPGEAALRDQATQALIDERKSRTEKLDNPPVKPPASEFERFLALPPDQQKVALQFRNMWNAAGRAPRDTTTSDNARLDRSYQYNATKLDTIAKPYRDQAVRLANLQSTVQQKTPQADALIAPELLTVMAGGQGSGLRMNEAEIARIVGGRSNMESLKAALNKWRLDPSQALSITDAQRAQIQSLLGEVSKRSQAHQQLISSAEDELVNADSVQAHRHIMQKLRNQLATADAALGTVSAPADNDVQSLIDDYTKGAGLTRVPQ